MHKIHILGLGIAQPVLLSVDAEVALKGASQVIGSERQLQLVAHLLSDEQQTQALPKLKNLSELIQKNDSNSVAVLASGDPLFYGIGRWFGKNFQSESLCFYPAVSSLQAACHQLGLSLQDVQVVSLHGRARSTLRRHLQAGKTLLCLTDKHTHPQALAEECRRAGFESSRLHICEQLGYPEQTVRTFTVTELLDSAIVFNDLHVTAIEVKGTSRYLPRFPGIADDAFITDSEPGKGLLTKREVRLAILSMLQPGPGDIGWDIGAGCGGVAVEWGYWSPQAQVYAIEHHAQRLECLAANIERFGVVSNVELISGRAPKALDDLPRANKIFIGGSDGELVSLLQLCWQQLPEGGVLVASGVTENTKQQLQAFYQQLQAEAELETLQLAISRGGELAGQLIYRPNLPVSLFRYQKKASQPVIKQKGLA